MFLGRNTAKTFEHIDLLSVNADIILKRKEHVFDVSCKYADKLSSFVALTLILTATSIKFVVTFLNEHRKVRVYRTILVALVRRSIYSI